jgi:hypothetical protein
LLCKLFLESILYSYIYSSKKSRIWTTRRGSVTFIRDCAHLNGRYANFGQKTSDLDVVGQVPVSEKSAGANSATVRGASVLVVARRDGTPHAPVPVRRHRRDGDRPARRRRPRSNPVRVASGPAGDPVLGVTPTPSGRSRRRQHVGASGLPTPVAVRDD